MKKSELKEIIKAAMIAEDELTIDESYADSDLLKKLGIDGDVMEMVKKMRAAIESGKVKDEDLGSIEGIGDAIKKMVVDGAKSFLKEAEKVDVEDNEDVDIDIEKEVSIDDESVESDIEVDASMPGESGDEVAVQSLLMKAQEEAAKLGDEKLTDQIGNTITYFTRAHVAQVDEGEEIDEIAAMPGEEGVEDVNIDDPAKDAMVGLTESDRWKRIAGITTDNGLYSK